LFISFVAEDVTAGKAKRLTSAAISWIEFLAAIPEVFIEAFPEAFFAAPAAGLALEVS
jgi:hypothetical protein